MAGKDSSLVIMPGKRRLLIVAHAPSPNTLRLRDAALEGASDREIANVEIQK